MVKVKCTRTSPLFTCNNTYKLGSLPMHLWRCKIATGHYSLFWILKRKHQSANILSGGISSICFSGRTRHCSIITFFFFKILGSIKSRTLCWLGKHFTTELHVQTCNYVLKPKVGLGRWCKVQKASIRTESPGSTRKLSSHCGSPINT